MHFSGELPGGVLLVEVRRPATGTTAPSVSLDRAAPTIDLLGARPGAACTPFADSQRLWLARRDLGDAPRLPTSSPRTAARSATGTCRASGRSRRTRPCSPRAGQRRDAEREPAVHHRAGHRPRRPGRRASRRSLLHTGVSSLEGGERPYPERYRVPRATADAINADARTMAVAWSPPAPPSSARWPPSPTTAASCTPARAGPTSWSLPTRRCASVDGLLTGWHEPESSHLLMLEAFADHAVLEPAYRAALDGGYRWHEFGDSHLILRERTAAMTAPRPIPAPSPALPAGRRAVLYAVRRRGEATVRAGRRAARHDRERRAPAPHRAGDATGWSRRASCRRPTAEARPAHPRVLRHRTPPTRTSRRRTASSPTSCSATSPTPTASCSTSCSPSGVRTASRTRRRGSRRSARSAPRSPSSPGSSTRTATSRAGRRSSPACTGSSSTTARSGRWPSATARRARARSTSSAPCSTAPTSSGCSTWSGARHCAYEVRAR